MSLRNALAVLLCIALLVILPVGCDRAEGGSTEPVTATEPSMPCEVVSAETVTEPPNLSHLSPVENLVIPAISKSYSWDDAVGNRNRVTIRLPHIASNDPFATEYNADIDAFAGQLNAEIDETAERACSTHLVSIDYEAWLNEDVLSILIITRTAIDYVAYRVDNFDLDDGEYMNTAEMCDEYLEMEYPQFLKLTQDMILRDFEAEHGDFAAQYPEDVKFIRELFETDAFVARNRCLYLNENGTLMLVCDRPSIAGAAYYSHIEEMKVDPSLIPTEEDAYNWLFDLYLGADEVNADYAAEILRIAYEDEEDDFMEALGMRPDQEVDAIKTAICVKYNTEG